MNIIDEIYLRIEKLGLWEQELVFNRNEYINKAGNTNTNLYYIVSGSLKIVLINEGEEHIIRFGYKNNIVTSIDSFLTNHPSEFTIQTIKKTVVKVISKSSFMDFINQNKVHKTLWNRVMELLILQQLEREKDLLTISPKERYRRVLKRSPQLFQEIPNKHIALYLRMTPETLSRLKKS